MAVRTGGGVTSRCATSSTANPTCTAWGANPGRQLTAVTMTTAYRVPYIGIYKFTSTDPTVNCLHEPQVQQRRMLRTFTSGMYRRVVYKRSPLFRTNLLPHLPGSICHRWTLNVHTKHQYPPITLYCATAQETAIWNFTTMVNQNLTLQSSITK